MSQYVDSKGKAFVANGAITAYARVKLDAAGTVSTAGATDKEIGIATRTVADGEPVDVGLRTGQGTHKATAEDAVAAGDAVYTAASGKVGDTGTGAFLVGTALEAATADGDIIEILYNTHGDTAAT